MKSEWIRFPLVLSIIAVLAALGLSKVYIKTKDAINFQEEQKVGGALKEVLPLASTFEICSLAGSSDSFWVGRDSQKQVKGFAYLGSYAGYSSPILCMVGMDTAGNILKIRILVHQETPGLGTRVQEISPGASIWTPHKKIADNPSPWFEKQFAGLCALKKIEVKTGKEWLGMSPEEKTKLLDENSIGALTGATISSKALAEAVTQKAPSILRFFYPVLTSDQKDSAGIDSADSLEQEKDDE